MKIRKLHRGIAIAFSPLFLFSAVSGSILLFRKTELYGKEAKELMVSLHTWEAAAPYVGIVLALGLMVVSISGIVLFFKRNA